ncbi:hypothetical protein CFOL_v3_09125 [Cephalotus follicularis]|uniref:BHLH domain-containing protein n=1 Tax=Cephalotus follicularis TaxID=3775 RepID=A0A1Q3BC94_CEPFO|nr:hypothetical protein CFOL_v3_09125 [Cephalotus follicularis]
MIEPVDELFYSDGYTNLLPYFSSPSPEIFPLENLESCYHYPAKRQKSYGNHYYHSNLTPNLLQRYIANTPPVPELFPEIPAPPPLPEFQVPEGFSCGSMGGKKASGVGSLSAQSLAARERRRRITEKTQELGKMIPGGHKMNTAEMFQAASKYVKFLQAQVGILQAMTSTKEIKEEPNAPQLIQSLLASPTIQEKLYTEEKCLIPNEFVKTLARDDDEIRSKLSTCDDFVQLLQTNPTYD